MCKMICLRHLLVLIICFLMVAVIARAKPQDSSTFQPRKNIIRITFDDVDFVLSRLKHISMRTSSNISEILAVQEDEFKRNTHYKLGWAKAAIRFNAYRQMIFNNSTRGSITQTVPKEYHIAIIAYTLEEPMVYKFNKDTREVCNGMDIDTYQWKSYFKLMELAIKTLGSQEDRWSVKRRFMYRGEQPEYNVKEGQILAFQKIISTSEKLTEAEKFSGKTLVEFQGYFNGTAMAIWDHSVYGFEKEILILPMQVFRVDSIHVGKHYTRYVLVKHTLASSNTSKLNSTTLKLSSSNSKVNANTFLISIFFISMLY